MITIFILEHLRSWNSRRKIGKNQSQSQHNSVTYIHNMILNLCDQKRHFQSKFSFHKNIKHKSYEGIENLEVISIQKEMHAGH